MQRGMAEAPGEKPFFRGSVCAGFGKVTGDRGKPIARQGHRDRAAVSVTMQTKRREMLGCMGAVFQRMTLQLGDDLVHIAHLVIVLIGRRIKGKERTLASEADARLGLKDLVCGDARKANPCLFLGLIDPYAFSLDGGVKPKLAVMAGIKDLGRLEKILEFANEKK